jgi:flagellar motor component MotA
VQTQADNGRVEWPPPADRETWAGDLKDLDVSQRPDDPVEGRQLEELSIDELASMYGEMTGIALREGILALEEVAAAPGVLSEGLRLAVDGTDRHLIRDILETRRETTVRNRRVRLRMMLEGVMSIMAGDNPWIVCHKMQVHFLDGNQQFMPSRVRERITGAELCQWREQDWLSTKTPADIAEMFLHLAFAARNEGTATALEPVLGDLEPAFLRDALIVGIRTRDPAQVKAEMTPRLEQEVAELEARLRAVTTGVLGIQAGDPSDKVAEAVRQAGTTVSD